MIVNLIPVNACVHRMVVRPSNLQSFTRSSNTKEKEIRECLMVSKNEKKNCKKIKSRKM